VPSSQSTILMCTCLHATAEYTRRVRKNSMYYLFYDGSQVLVIESELGAVLTQRLLLHAQLGVDADSYKVFGAFEDADVIWFVTERPFIYPLGLYVEPRTFTEDKSNKYWSLLEHEDAKRLAMHWKSLQNYKKSSDKTNYFKNAVDHFVFEMEKRWSK